MVGGQNRSIDTFSLQTGLYSRLIFCLRSGDCTKLLYPLVALSSLVQIEQLIQRTERSKPSVFFLIIFRISALLISSRLFSYALSVTQEEKNIIPPNYLRHFRQEAKLSQSDVAFLLDIKNGGRISEWENGLSYPSIEHLFTLSLIYQKLPDRIFYELRKRQAEKLTVRYRLLREFQEQKRLKRESG